MLGDDEEQSARNVPDRASVPPGRGAVVVADRGRGYGAYEWYGEEPHEDVGIDIQKYLRILRKHWMWIMMPLVLCIAAGVAMTMLATKMYTSAVTIQIEREAARVGNLETAQPRDVSSADEFFQTQHNLLKSRALALKTVDDHGLATDAALLAGVGVGQPGENGRRPSLSQIREQLAGYIQGSIEVVPVGRSRIVQVSVETPNPNASARIANTVAESFIAWNLQRKLEQSVYAQEFLKAKMLEEEEKLATSERELAGYAAKQGIISIASGSTADGAPAAEQTLTGSSLLAINTALTDARAARIRAEQRLASATAARENSREVLENATIQSLKQEIAQLQGELRNRLAVYQPTEQNTARIQAQIDDLQRTLAVEVESVLRSLDAEYKAAQGEETQLQAQLGRLEGSFHNENTRSIELGIEERKVDTSRQQYEDLLAEYKSVSIAGGIENNNVSIVDAAQPGGQSRPQPVKNIMTAAMVGLFLGVALAFLIEYMDESIRAPEDVERKLALPLLGTIPKLERGTTPLEALEDIRSPFSESYYSVRTALQFSTDEGVPSSLLVTSARPSEGKSTSAVAIAQNFARLGLRVLLIDSDLRNPSLHRTMQVENSAGLSNFLTGGLPLSRLVKETQIPGLMFIPCGPLPPNPAELLAGSRVELLLKEARQHFDIVVLDGPPIMGLADAPILASGVAGTIIVIEAGGTGRNLARVALRRLNVGAPRILGVLLTKFDAKKSSYGYGYGYGYAYDYNYGSRPQIQKSGN